MKYDAFISYSHSDCGNMASVVQKALENIGKPWYKLHRNLTIFRDETNLSASPKLWNSIVNALDESSNLILLASPLAKASYWINKEIEYWFSKKRQGNLYIVLTKGNIIWNHTQKDFDWEKTNCLPPDVKEKFKEEPLWIDVREYINIESINYKQAGFTSSLAKVIGGILGKPPREIESDELKRKRKTMLALIIGITLLLLIAAAGTVLFYQNRINKKNAITNSIISEGNKYRKSDINKAILLYAYAYFLNSTEENYDIVNGFYKEIVEDKYYVEGKYYSSFLNKFPKKIADFNLFADTESAENDRVNKIGVTTDGNNYYLINELGISIYQLSTKKNTYYRTFSKEKIIDTQINDDNDNVLIETDKSNLYNYNVLANQLDTIAIDGLFLSKENIYTDWFGYGYYQSFAKDSKIIIFQGKEKFKNFFLLYVYDILKKSYTKYRISSDVNSVELNFNLLMFSSKNDESCLYYSHSMDHGSSYNTESLVVLEPKMKNIYKVGPTYYSTRLNTKGVLFLENSVITAKKNGEIFHHTDFGYKDERWPIEADNIVYGLNNIRKYDDYLITSYDNGDLNFYILLGINIPLVKSVSLTKGDGINRLFIVKNMLFISTNFGKLYSVELNKIMELEKNRGRLLNQLRNELGINDLSNEEKNKLKIVEE